MDVGGTHMRAALVDSEGRVVLRRVRPTPHHAEVPSAVTDLIRSVAGENRSGAAVVGLPGPVDYRAGRLLWAPHLPEAWPEQLSERQLAEQVGIAVHLANDADVAAVGEAYFGAGRGEHDVAYVTISTGIGAGVVFDGQLLCGDRSLAEIGHTVIDRDAWDSGRPATLEELASGSGMTRMATEAGLGALDGEELEVLVASGEATATGVWEAAVDAASIGVINLIMAFAPGVVVLGGGVGRRPTFFDHLVATVERRMRPGSSKVRLVLDTLGDDAGLVGAARWIAATSRPAAESAVAPPGPRVVTAGNAIGGN
ncbi:ROK family protein [Candidatus Aeolococcus gillhamiae]|uniref:ROK family protein n=1 Tax=Candidatus Aeolococcus gillhamiae TaxID=3127015 RepID=UPI0030789A72